MPRSPSIYSSRGWPRECHWHRHQSQFKKHTRHRKRKYFAFSITDMAILISSWKQKKMWIHMTSFLFCIPFCSGHKKARSVITEEGLENIRFHLHCCSISTNSFGPLYTALGILLHLASLSFLDDSISLFHCIIFCSFSCSLLWILKYF